MSIVVSRSSRTTLTLLLALLALTGLSTRPSSAAYNVPVPSQLLLTVRETAGIARSGEVVRSGVPIPRSLNLRSTGSLAVVDASGKAVPADFQITARWNAGLSDTNAPIQWLLVTFPASVAAKGSATFRLVTNGTVANPAPVRPLRLTQNGALFTVDTGAAIFRFGSDPGGLFDEVVLDNGTRLIGGSDMTIRSGGASAGHSTTRKVRVEHSGPLSAVVVIHGAYDLAPVGNGQIGSVRRYVFTAGSPTAVVRHVAQWEGNLGCNGCTKTSTGAPNGVRLEQVRDTLSVSLGGTSSTVTAVGDFDTSAVTGSVGAGHTAEVRQLLRSSRTAPHSFRAAVGGTASTGSQADGGMLAASGPSGAVAIGLTRMHRYEPQALRRLADGSLAIDLADGNVWLAHHQGMFAEIAVSALPPAPTRAQLDRLVWAPLNRPLRAWPSPAWFASSDAVDEIPVGTLPAALASYDTVIPSILERTLVQTDLLGISGLMTFGVFPRYWGQQGAPGEIDCGASGDPTPAEAWDNTFWCGTWTDYHNTASTAPIWAMRSGQVEWLDEISVPAALRTLHTQVMRCGPGEKWFYCGQSPAGYGGYRADFNSSHAYFENLYLYYWLTGDSTVTETLRRGGENMRRMMCDTRGPKPVIEPLTGPGGPACGADHVSTTSEFTGRVASQWINAFRFLGHASEDGSFLEDFRSGLSRAVTQYYVEAKRNNVSYGFLGERSVTAGTYIAGPVWIQGFYDTNNLFRLLRDTNNAPIGNPALPPSQVMTAVARMLKDIEPTVMGDGTVDGDWPRNIEYTWSGSRIGGTLVATAPNDRPIYTPEKVSVMALFLRTGEMSGDASLRTKGEEMLQVALSAAAGEGAPLGKLQGQYLTRLHAAVARMTNQGGTSSEPPPPPPPPPPTGVTAPSDLVAAGVSTTEIKLTWKDNSTNEENFLIEKLTNGVFKQFKMTGPNITTVKITGLTAATAYTFRVRAATAAETSAYSNTSTASTFGGASVAPAAPRPLQARAVSGTVVELTWKDNSRNETEFRIEKLVGGRFVEIRQVGANETTARISGLSPGKPYAFRVRATNPGASSAYSNVARVNTKSAR